MLRASVIGNLGGDPEVRYTQAGEQLVTLSVAVNQRKRLPDSEEWKESTNWIRVRCSGWRAEAAQQLTKGQRVYVCGRLEINEYVRRDGTPGISHDLWADEVHSMSSKPEQTRTPVAAGANSAAAESGDDLPF